MWGKDYERHLCSGRLLCVKNGMRLVVKRMLVKSGSVYCSGGLLTAGISLIP